MSKEKPDGQGDYLDIGGRRFKSRLFVGTGKYPDFRVMAEALEASGTEVVTVAVRRVNLTDRSKESLLDHIDRTKYMLLPNTAGCFSAEEAIRTARLAREAGLSDFIKLEVIGDRDTLMPDPLDTLRATESLVKEGFKVMAYTSDDPIAAKRLEEAGAVAVMPLGAPIGSGLGILNPTNISMIIAAARGPIIVDAGVGTASDVSIAMELGADGVLLNTGVAGARDPVLMAKAVRLAIEAGRLAHLAGRIPRKAFAVPSSPAEGRIGT